MSLSMRVRVSSIVVRARQARVVLRRATPEYPRSAEKRELEGMVVIEFTVDESGQGARSSRGQAELELGVRSRRGSAINRWDFKPVVENGRPVPVRTWAKFVFRP